MKLHKRIQQAIKRQAGNIILRADLAEMGSASQVTKALGALQDDGVLIRIGTGVYAKTKKSTVTGAIIPAGSLETLAMEALLKLGVEVFPCKAAVEYNSGKTTQLPGKFVVNTGRRRITRRIEVGGRKLAYEKDYGRTDKNAPVLH